MTHEGTTAEMAAAMGAMKEAHDAFVANRAKDIEDNRDPILIPRVGEPLTLPKELADVADTIFGFQSYSVQQVRITPRGVHVSLQSSRSTLEGAESIEVLGRIVGINVAPEGLSVAEAHVPGPFSGTSRRLAEASNRNIPLLSPSHLEAAAKWVTQLAQSSDIGIVQPSPAVKI